MASVNSSLPPWEVSRKTIVPLATLLANVVRAMAVLVAVRVTTAITTINNSINPSDSVIREHRSRQETCRVNA
jgi:hypothetical protein